MTSRQRLQATLNHQAADRVCVDFGATSVTGIHVSAVSQLRRALLGEPDFRVKVIEPYQMLGEIDDALAEALGVDVVGLPGRKSLLGTQNTNWKPFRLFDGTEVLVPGDFNTTVDASGDLLIYPEGDTSVAASAHMPKDGHFFDAIIRQEPIDEGKLDPADNLEEFGLLSADDLAWYHDKLAFFDQRASAGHLLSIPGSAFGDIALVPAPFLKHPRGIRDVEEWYISTVARPEYILAIFERQCEIAEQNLRTLIDLLGDRVDVAFTTGTDFGTQRGTFISREAYQNLYKPFHKRINDLIHSRSHWKTFIHSCGSVYDLVPDFIDAGFDVLNPVQCSAACMDAATLKREFGRHLTFWGGGVDTQKILPFATPQEVYDQVRQRIEIFQPGGGFVFTTIHNIQAGTPTGNMLAMFRAVRDSG